MEPMAGVVSFNSNSIWFGLPIVPGSSETGVIGRLLSYLSHSVVAQQIALKMSISTFKPLSVTARLVILPASVPLRISAL